MIFNLLLTESTTIQELADIRTGANGQTYPSAGDAVRGQVSDLQDELDEIAVSYDSDNKNIVITY